MEEFDIDYERIQEELESSVMRDIKEIGLSEEECIEMFDNWLRRYRDRDTES